VDAFEGASAVCEDTVREDRIRAVFLFSKNTGWDTIATSFLFSCHTGRVGTSLTHAKTSAG
jgi:hypothetical protein